MSRTPARRAALNALRKKVGRNSRLETWGRGGRNLVRYHSGRPIGRRDFFAAKNGGGQPFGVFGFGGCDLNSLVKAGPLLTNYVDGPTCVISAGRAARAHSRVMVQTLNPPPSKITEDVSERLELDPRYFKNEFLQPEMTVQSQGGLGSFPKNVVVMSLSADTGRSVYRHREHGFVVDPGGWWLTADMASVLKDLSAVQWFSKNFKKMGRISVEDSMANYRTLIAAAREELGAFVVMMNVLTVDPGLTAVDYKFSNSPNRTRRREFDIALKELAREMSFPVLDADRLAKREGISGQEDFVHYTPHQKAAIAEELVRILLEHEIISERKRNR